MTEPGPIDDALLQAARRALANWGRSASLERIAEEAGLSRVTLYRRGVSREAILDALATRALEDYRAALWPALTARGTGAERLERALRGVCESAERYRGLLEHFPAERDAVFHEEGADGGERLTRSTFTDPLVRLLEDGRADGTLRADDPAEVATVLFNLVGWTYLHLRSGHGWRPEHARDAVIAVAMHGVAAR